MSSDRQWCMQFRKDKTGEALFSPCEKYRYKLWRHFTDIQAPRFVNFIMLNPSTADQNKNDPTVERCERRAREWGFDGLTVTNLFAWRATDKRELLKCADPIGPDNDYHLKHEAWAHDVIICAWGNPYYSKRRAEDVLKLLGLYRSRLRILKIGESGVPCHPLYLPYSLQPTVWTPLGLPTG